MLFVFSWSYSFSSPCRHGARDWESAGCGIRHGGVVDRVGTARSGRCEGRRVVDCAIRLRARLAGGGVGSPPNGRRAAPPHALLTSRLRYTAALSVHASTRSWVPFPPTLPPTGTTMSTGTRPTPHGCCARRPHHPHARPCRGRRSHQAPRERLGRQTENRRGRRWEQRPVCQWGRHRLQPPGVAVIPSVGTHKKGLGGACTAPRMGMGAPIGGPPLPD